MWRIHSAESNKCEGLLKISIDEPYPRLSPETRHDGGKARRSATILNLISPDRRFILPDVIAIKNHVRMIMPLGRPSLPHVQGAAGFDWRGIGEIAGRR